MYSKAIHIVLSKYLLFSERRYSIKASSKFYNNIIINKIYHYSKKLSIF